MCGCADESNTQLYTHTTPPSTTQSTTQATNTPRSQYSMHAAPNLTSYAPPPPTTPTSAPPPPHTHTTMEGKSLPNSHPPTSATRATPPPPPTHPLTS